MEMSPMGVVIPFREVVFSQWHDTNSLYSRYLV